MEKGLAGLSAALGGTGVKIEQQLAAYSLLKRDWHNRLRRLEESLVYLVASGRFWFCLEGRRFEMKTGDLLWIDPHTEHECGLHSPEDQVRLYHFRFRIRFGAEEWPGLGEPLLLSDAGELFPWAAAWVHEGHPAAGQQHRALRLTSLLVLFITTVQRLESREGTDRAGLSRAQSVKLETIVDEHLDLRLTARDLARELGLSIPYFRVLFHATYRSSVRSWLVERRIRHAAVMLAESSAPVGEVARAFGYDSLPLFTRQFTEIFRLSPSVYRKNGG